MAAGWWLQSEKTSALPLAHLARRMKDVTTKLSESMCDASKSAEGLPESHDECRSVDVNLPELG